MPAGCGLSAAARQQEEDKQQPQSHDNGRNRQGGIARLRLIGARRINLGNRHRRQARLRGGLGNRSRSRRIGSGGRDFGRFFSGRIRRCRFNSGRFCLGFRCGFGIQDALRDRRQA